VYNVLQINSTQKQSAVLIDEPNHLRRYGPSLDAKTDAAFNNSLVFRSCWTSRHNHAFSATRPKVPVQQHNPHSELPASIVGLYDKKYPTLAPQSYTPPT